MAIEDSSLAELFYTSGTIGNPKGVMLSHRTVYLHGLNRVASLPYYRSDLALAYHPSIPCQWLGKRSYSDGQGRDSGDDSKFEPQDVCR